MYGKVLNEGFTDGFKSLKNFLYRKYLPRKYKFYSKVPYNPNTFKQIPVHLWKAQVQLDARDAFNTIKFISIFIIGFGISDIITSSIINSKDSYWMYHRYPRLMRKLDDNFLENKEFLEWFEILKGFWVKDYVELRNFWGKVGEKLFDDSEKVKMKDEKVMKLKEEIKEMDLKFPLPASNKNVF